MAQQISVEDAFPTFQKRCRELFEENLLLRAQVEVLERQLTAAKEETERLQQAAGEPTSAAGDLEHAQPAPYAEGEPL